MIDNDIFENTRSIFVIIVAIVAIGIGGFMLYQMSDQMMTATERVSTPTDNLHPLYINSSGNYTNTPVYIDISQATYPGLFVDIRSNQNHFQMMSSSETVIPHYTEVVSGSHFRVWVRAPSVSTLNNTRIYVNPLHISSYDHSSTSTFDLFDINAESIYRFEGDFTDQLSNHDGTAIAGTATTTTGNYGRAGAFNSTAKQAVSLGDLTGVYESGITVAGWVNNSYYAADNYQAIASIKGFDDPLRFNTTAAAYSRFDMTTVDADLKGYIGAVTDGRYVYFVPFNNGAVFGKVARYDTTQDFAVAGSWSAFNMTTVDADLKGYQGAVTDGRYVYFVPNNNGAAFGKVARYDTTQDFAVAGSWSAFDMTTVDADLKGYQGAVTDGRYVYFVPHYNGAYFGKVARYDTTQDFAVAGSWSAFDMTTVDADLKGYYGAVTDGRYVYFVPNNNGARFGKVARYDTTSDLGFALSATSPSNSFGGMPPGPSFVIGTAATSAGDGQRAAFTNKNLTAGWHHVAGTYDGQTVSLYVDGTLVGQNTYADAADITSSSVVAYLAGAPNSSMFLNGNLDELVIVPRAMTASEISTLATQPNYLDVVTLNTGDTVVNLKYNVVGETVIGGVDPTLEHGIKGATYEYTERHLTNITDIAGSIVSILIIAMIAVCVMGAMFLWMRRD